MNIVRDYPFSVFFLWSSQIGAACRVVLFLDDVFTSLPLLTSPWLIWDMNRIIVVGLASLRFLLALILSMLFYSSTEWSNPRFVFFLLLMVSSCGVQNRVRCNITVWKRERTREKKKKNDFPCVSLSPSLLLSARHRRTASYHLSLTAVVICGFSLSSFFCVIKCNWILNISVPCRSKPIRS